MLSYFLNPDLGKDPDAPSSAGTDEYAQGADRPSARVVGYSLSTRIMANAEDRYRTLLDVSST
ncbi:MAG: hypothetical protein WB555_12015, partial [Candidatus Korobacteraceae bacterium]